MMVLSNAINAPRNSAMKLSFTCTLGRNIHRKICKAKAKRKPISRS
jgi:hypothetical protein